MNQKNPQNAVTEPKTVQEFAIFTSLMPAIAGAVARKRNVPRKSPNSSGRERATQSPCGIQAPDRREVRRAILHHFAGWEGCTSLSLRGVAADRAEAGQSLELQSNEEKVSEPYELLRPGGGDRWAGPSADSGAAAGFGKDPGRGGRCRQPYIPRGTEHRGIPQRYRREPVHG